MKKTLSLFLAIVVLVTSISISFITSTATEPPTYTNINALALDVQNALLSFNDGEHICRYKSGEVVTDSQLAIEKLEKELRKAVFTLNDYDPELGQYLQKSGEIEFAINYHNVEKFFEIVVTEKHSLTEAEEEYLKEFAKVFKNQYIPAGASDYTKVKTIYDFVVRNTTYDHDLFVDNTKNGNTKYPKTSDRFRISHSAYGAIKGNQLSYLAGNVSKLENSSNINIGYSACATPEQKKDFIEQVVASDFASIFKSKNAINDEKIVTLQRKNGRIIQNGLAVCEGYSKLFYYLCVYNGIKARIVDGDYVEYISNNKSEITSLYGDIKSNKASDPHEWNYVYLDDDDDSVKQWFIVDATWGSQKSVPNVDYNNYDYFLIGTKFRVDGSNNPLFSIMEHQQPYVENGPNQQLYNWYLNENKANDTDYNIPLINLGSFEFGDDDSVVIERKTVYKEMVDGVERNVEKHAYILQSKDSAVKITINDNDNLTTNVGGFDYNGKKNSKYTLIIPYLTNYEYKSQPITNISNVGKYTATANGKIIAGIPSKFSVDFKIVPVDMSVNYKEISIDKTASYNGHEIKPSASIVDGYGNKLTTSDYDIKFYQSGKQVPLKEMGEYDVSIDFKGNYTKSYKFKFKVGKINLNDIALTEYSLPYLPEHYRKEQNVTNAADFFNSISSLKVGTQTLVNGTDYTVVSGDGIANYGDSGTLTIMAVSTSSKVAKNTKKVGKYKVSQKFDISGSKTSTNGSNMNNQPADSNTKNRYFYDGTAKKPTAFDNLDKKLKKGKDYKIVSYSNNVNAGKASVVIEGINGCSGKATMYFVINPANISTAKTSFTVSGTSLKAKVVWNGKTLVLNRDYTMSAEKQSSTRYLVTIKGINNFAGTLKVTTTVDQTLNYIKPTASGNKLQLSKNSFEYTGSQCKPTVSLINSNGKAVDPYFYTVKYSNNKKIGTAKVTLTFRNGYSGSVSTTFTINPKGTTISKLTASKKGFTAKWKKQTSQTNGYQIQLATDKKFKKGLKTYEVSKNSTTSKKITKLTGKKKYYVRVRTFKKISGQYYYSTWSTAKTVTTKK